MTLIKRTKLTKRERAEIARFFEGRKEDLTEDEAVEVARLRGRVVNLQQLTAVAIEYAADLHAEVERLGAGIAKRRKVERLARKTVREDRK